MSVIKGRVVIDGNFIAYTRISMQKHKNRMYGWDGFKGF